jgi:hypothetical protein
MNWQPIGGLPEQYFGRMILLAEEEGMVLLHCPFEVPLFLSMLCPSSSTSFPIIPYSLFAPGKLNLAPYNS